MSDGRQGRSEGQKYEERTATVASGGRSAAEWTTLAISCAVLATVLGVLLHAHLTRGGHRSAIVATVETTTARSEGERYVVPVRVRNTGSTGARNVRVRVTLEAPAGAQGAASGLREAELALEVLAAGAEATGVAVFLSATPGGRVRADVVSYADP